MLISSKTNLITYTHEMYMYINVMYTPTLTYTYPMQLWLGFRAYQMVIILITGEIIFFNIFVWKWYFEGH